MISEIDVQNSWRKLWQDAEVAPISKLKQADALLEELRPESPLYHRLAQELSEIRSLHAPNSKKRKSK